ncbi:hypothetical protein ACFVJS_07100, partial [Nocardioides sp. NPDC057772]|uniref:hypothetical protein n=1 Tax=Nocardioides sp. NPDC057772 TaxID=3346245 RepID=UPI00366A613B
EPPVVLVELLTLPRLGMVVHALPVWEALDFIPEIRVTPSPPELNRRPENSGASSAFRQVQGPCTQDERIEG